MKSKIARICREVARQVVTVFCLFAVAANGSTIAANVPSTGSNASPLASAGKSYVPAAPVKVNRTVPKVDPPKTTLEFSADPTLDEIFRVRMFEEPLVPVGDKPSRAENAALAAALLGYAKRSGRDDFSSITDFLEKYPKSPWRAALLTNLGLQYYQTAHFSLALEAWSRAWVIAKDAKDLNGRAVADRAAGELAYMLARLGRMEELTVLFQSFEGRVFRGSATEKIAGARQGLANMQERPEIAFRCGPLALHRIKLSIDPKDIAHATVIIGASASTQKGFSLRQVAELSQKLGLNFQMAYRTKGAAFIVPSVVHWKVGHYAAMIRKDGDTFRLEDPTFRNDIAATTAALETETSGYFLVPQGDLPSGWRKVDAKEGSTVWGKGEVGDNDPEDITANDLSVNGDNCKADGKGMAVASVHLMDVNLNLKDQPLGYTPPLGPPVQFGVRYNQRESYQPEIFDYSNFGPKWTFDWNIFIIDIVSHPTFQAVGVMKSGGGGGGGGGSTSASGGARTFSFPAGSTSSEPQRKEQTTLVRTSADSFELLNRDGSKLVFSHPSQPANTGNEFRRIFLTKIIDPAGNAITFTRDANLRLIAATDALGQVTTLSYDLPGDIYKVTKVTDPFGRFATFDYDGSGRLTKITDVICLTSQFTYEDTSDFVNSLITPYGTTTFAKAEEGTTRSLETLGPDGSKYRVEFNQTINIPYGQSDPSETVPTGMLATNQYLSYRNTFYWSKIASATGYGDYGKAKVYHWQHTPDLTSASGILECVKEPLENRVWYNYPDQYPYSYYAGSSNKPTHIGRVLDHGSTQLYTYEYNGFGKVTKSIDPVGRTFSYVYAANGIDLLEVRQTRAGANELLWQATYNGQHLPLTIKDAAGQTTTYTYNDHGQLLTVTNAKNETTTYTYDRNGYLTNIDGPLPGKADSTAATYDGYGRIRSITDSDNYTVLLDYDALDRSTRFTFPDGTFEQYTYDRLSLATLRDRSDRLTSYEYNNARQLTKKTDPLGRSVLYQWCKCGVMEALTDPLGRTTTWSHDIQGRTTHKAYADGSKVIYQYEDTSSRLRQRIDATLQMTQYDYNLDNTLQGKRYSNTCNATPSVTFSYDPAYERLSSMVDGNGTTLYSYFPITETPLLGAGQLASVDGPLENDTTIYQYDSLRRPVSMAVDNVNSSWGFDAAGRVTYAANALGSFLYTYDGPTNRALSMTYPNGQTTTLSYGNNLSDHRLERITNSRAGSTLSEFTYAYDVPAARITTWSQQFDSQVPFIYTIGYDAANQLTSASEAQNGSIVKTFSYTYDLAGNRLSEQIDSSATQSGYNALNQLTTQVGQTEPLTTYEWDAEERLTGVNVGNQRIEFSYDGFGHRTGIRSLIDGSEVSNRRFLWCGDEICQERTSTGAVTKRFFTQGVKTESGATPGIYYYTRDHLGSVRELTDTIGNTRASYSYDVFGRATRASGDVDTDFGFAGMHLSKESGLSLTKYRAYDPEVGRWISRDALEDGELYGNTNLYAYANNSPVNFVDPNGKHPALFLLLVFVVAALSVQSSDDVAGHFHVAEALACGFGTAAAPASVATEEFTLAERVYSAERSGQALAKSDPAHRAASFLSREQLEAGQAFTVKGGDGVTRELLQVEGNLNGKSGIYEYILDPAKGVTHQRFIEDGVITGFPNQ
jgi:RHS repeat-associated protein